MSFIKSSNFMPHSIPVAMHTDANASLTSMTPMSLILRPARFSALADDGAGPVSAMTGSTPITAIDLILALALSPSSSAFSLEASSIAQAWSFTLDEFPAVTFPVGGLNAGGNLASFSSEVCSGTLRGPSSLSTVLTVPSGCLTSVSGIISFLNLPASCAATAFWWLHSANLSICSLGILYFSPTASPASPMFVIGYCLYSLAPANELTTPSATPIAYFDMFSTPPPTAKSAFPVIISVAAN